MERGASYLHALKTTICTHSDPDESHFSRNWISFHNFQIFHLFISRSSNYTHSLRLTNNDPVYTSPVHHTCHMPYLPPFPIFRKFSCILWSKERKSFHNLTLTFGSSCMSASWQYTHVARALYHKQHTATGDAQTMWASCCWRNRSFLVSYIPYVSVETLFDSSNVMGLK